MSVVTQLHNAYRPPATHLSTSITVPQNAESYTLVTTFPVSAIQAPITRVVLDVEYQDEEGGPWQRDGHVVLEQGSVFLDDETGQQIMPGFMANCEQLRGKSIRIALGINRALNCSAVLTINP